MLAHIQRVSLIAALALVTLAVAAVSRAADDARQDKDTDADRKKMQGEWAAPSAGREKTIYTFKDDKLSVKAPSRSYEITVTLDATAKPEKSIDLKIEKAPEDAKGKTSKGIYKFEGDDKLVVCFRGEGERPAKFEQIGFEQILVELTRKKADSK